MLNSKKLYNLLIQRLEPEFFINMFYVLAKMELFFLIFGGHRMICILTQISEHFHSLSSNAMFSMPFVSDLLETKKFQSEDFIGRTI